MPPIRALGAALAACAAAALLQPETAGAQLLESLQPGKLELRSAGVLAFGPEGILFVGDSAAGGVFAIDTGDRGPAAGAAVEIPEVSAKLAALLGTAPDQIQIQDVAVNPLSQRVYFSVARGRGPDAPALLFRSGADGALEEVSLGQVSYSWVALPNAPASDAADRRGRPLRQQAITDLGYADGTLYIAGLSNEEFASKLRAVKFPFQSADAGTSVEIFHGAHGRYETNSPVRTFVPYQIDGQAHLLAAYTCTPLVKFPVASLQPGQKLQGTTIAELGAGNRPLDMIVYSKGGQDYVLMSNSERGVMKLPTAGFATLPAIREKTEIAGAPYETIAELQNVQQLDRLDGERAVVLLANASGALDLRTIALP